ncbi:hypothetical protein H0H93_007381, partial [Arthromyces matolae]
GLQGSYNAYSTKRNIHIPHGDVLVFALACGQIVYAFLLRPDTLPHSYSTWIGQAAKVPPECVKINHGLVRQGTCDPALIDRITSLPVNPHIPSLHPSTQFTNLNSHPGHIGLEPNRSPLPPEHPPHPTLSLLPTLLLPQLRSLFSRPPRLDTLQFRPSRQLTALGMAMVMSAYQNDPQHLSGFVRRILYQFIGPN